MPLSDVHGQTHAVESLHRALHNDRLHHAYLFAGPDGVGKGLCARNLAQALLCTQPQDADACGTCRACQRVTDTQHPDLHCLARGKKSDGTVEKSIRIAQVRALQERLTYKAFEGARRVVIIYEAEKMNAATANALLKTLEEPGPGTHFILISTAPHRLLPTVISRSQRVRFVPLPREMVAQHLTRLLEDVDPMKAELLAGLAEGSISKGIELANSTALDHRAEVVDLMHAPTGLANLPALFDKAESLARTKGDLPLVFHLLRTWYRDLLLIQKNMPTDTLVHRDRQPMLAKLATTLTQKEILGRIDALNTTEYAIFERSGNARLFLEKLFVTLAGVHP